MFHRGPATTEYRVSCRAGSGSFTVESKDGQVGACIEALRRLTSMGIYGEHTITLKQANGCGGEFKWKVCIDSLEGE